MASSNSLVVLKDAIFKPQHFGKAIFRNPVSIEILSSQKWAIIGSHKSFLLSALAGKFTAIPANSRQYPFLSKLAWPASACTMVAFDNFVSPAYLSARYESYREPEDVTTAEFLLNSIRDINEDERQKVYLDTIKRLGLEALQNQWIVTLSNGQMRRARIARGLLKAPKILLADEPFLGLDPAATSSLSDMLGELAPNPHVILGLRVHEPIPEWISHLAIVDDSGIVASGIKSDVSGIVKDIVEKRSKFVAGYSFDFKANGMTLSKLDSDEIINIDNITIAYRGKVVLKELNWTVRRGERWHLRGNNGTGKSTLLSLLTADHPQSWNSKISIFGEPRRAGKHNYFSINKTIGHASPEIHAIFPKSLTAHQAVSTGFSVGSFLPPSNFTHTAGNLTKDQRNDRIEILLKYFEIKGDTLFSDLSLNDQKLVLFIRAVIKCPEILILDEAFSGMNDKSIALCKKFVRDWSGTVIAIGHIEDEIPDCTHYIRLHGGELPATKGVIAEK
ncbi:P-loop containing nucleoside triphosphate hydrolase protein [Dipodascopsis uninucleata]